ncbi:MAG: hypothetical protein AMQ22_00038 [Candidatus Methanofastidiosum methylothiophilum]|uniref:Uncharacterized protein n=1 Tax=Candidatus Methanofastidiosum methylothiophilum TaxID=1705564 RepID=A0A150J9C8_9EURY|nr:MAG: hypothetical protein AMQ22_00038 [Candidatus Methanofastidiosum methylthiophilus]
MGGLIKFSEDYPKLENEYFTTIRRYIPDGFLLKDTGRATREEAVELLNSFYKKPIAKDEKLTIYVIIRRDLE